MSDSKQGHVADKNLDRLGSAQSKPPAPSYAPSKDGEIPDPTLPFLPGRPREF
jgi:hypothetical protein